MSEEVLEFVQIEYATCPTQSSGVPWALVAVDHGSPNDVIIVFEITASSTWIVDEDRDYLDAMLLDWRMTLNRNGAELLDSLKNLVVGPLRPGTSGACSEEELVRLARALDEQLQEPSSAH